jgi:hypothetical protein
MPQRSITEAEKAVSEATDLVVKDGGVIHEEGMWDANEAALDGASTERLFGKEYHEIRPLF